MEALAALPEPWRLYFPSVRAATFRNWPFTEGCACTPERVSAGPGQGCGSGGSGAGRALTASPVPADGGGGFRALPQREQPRRGAVLLLPQGAGGLGARGRPSVSTGDPSASIPPGSGRREGLRAARWELLLLFYFIFLVAFFSREEHKKHSADCGFLSLQKEPANLTVQEFLKLDKMRMRKALVRTLDSSLWLVQLASFLATRLCCVQVRAGSAAVPFPGSQPCFTWDVSHFPLEAERYST